MKTIKAYTDGSYNVYNKKFGYGVYMTDGKKEFEFFGGALDTTGGRQVNGEIIAAKKAINVAVENGYESIIIYYDYEGVAKWAKGEWKTNKDYTKEYARFVKENSKKIHIEFIHIKSHTGNAGNEKADKLAKRGCKK